MEQPLSASQRIHERLEAIISATAPGGRLLTEPKLAMQLGVSRATLREAMRTFETQGLIRRRQGSGTYVVSSSPIIESGIEVLESIETQAERIGLKVSANKLKIEHRPANDDEAQAFGIAAGDMVYHVSRVILAEGIQAAFLVDILPEDIFDPQELHENFSGSVLDLLLQRGSPLLASSKCEINAVTASADVAKSLGIQRGDVLLRMKAWLYTTTGRVVDYSFSYFLPGHFRFHVVRRVGRGVSQSNST